MSGAAIPREMRAWRSRAPGLSSLTLEHVPCPSPSAAEALVLVEAAALNYSDLLMIDDKYQIRPERPFTPGQEIAGIVVSAGAASGLGPGQRVASKVLWGGFAEFVLVRGDMAIPLPAGMNARTGAALPVSYTTAMVALTESTRLTQGEVLLVHAATGATGLAALQVGKALGARVIATAGGAAKCALALEHGADLAFDYSTPDWVDKVRAATGGRGVDVIFDPVGGEVTTQSLRCLAWQGRLLIVGFSSGTIPALPANRLLLRRASAIGVYWSHDQDGAMVRAIEQRLVALLTAGRIQPLVETRDGLEQLPQALADLAARRTSGKLVLRLHPPGATP